MFYLFCFIIKKKKKRFTTFLYVLKISSNISLVKELKKLSSKRRQIFYFILSPVFFFFSRKRKKEYNCIHLAYHHFNYNHLRAKQILQPNTVSAVSMEYNATKRLCYRSLPSKRLFSETRMPRGTSNRYNYSIYVTHVDPRMHGFTWLTSLEMLIYPRTGYVYVRRW